MEANKKALREALCDIVMLTMKVGHSIRGDVACGIIASKAKHALKQPPRNCDVGSVAEQKERFKDFCKEGKLSRIDLGAYCAYDCPCRDSYDCKLEWAQMPYEERKGDEP